MDGLKGYHRDAVFFSLSSTPLPHAPAPEDHHETRPLSARRVSVGRGVLSPQIIFLFFLFRF